jgi:hypothetical protein
MILTRFLVWLAVLTTLTCLDSALLDGAFFFKGLKHEKQLIFSQMYEVFDLCSSVLL